jgi:hypothetical protein
MFDRGGKPMIQYLIPVVTHGSNTVCGKKGNP